MIESLLNFESKSDILNTCDVLIKNEHILDDLLKVISHLERGKVKPIDTIRRSEVGSYFTASTQQINNYLNTHNLKLDKKLKVDLKRIAFKADKILRENIVLQTVPPLDVIKYTDVPKRHSYSSFGGRERRWGYGLHMKNFNEDGNSITLANMPPHYTQSIHNHQVSEYCLIIGTKTEGIYYPGKTKERIYSTNKSQIFHFSATTPHTLKNPTNKHKMNLTFKQASALLDWRPATDLNTVKIVRARVVKGRLKSINNNLSIKTYTIHDKYYNYKIEVLKLAKGSTHISEHSYNQFIFVLDGRLEISHGDIRKSCNKKDFIVIDKNTKYEIMTKTLCRLYTVRCNGIT